jgi:hypothetical protein
VVRDSSEVEEGDRLALAEAVIGALLGRLERQRRDPDLWESWHVLMALQALAHHEHREAVHWIGAALMPASKRPDMAARALSLVTSAGGLRLETLRALFEGVRSSSALSRTLH